MKLIVDKEYFKNLPNGTHTIKAKFVDGTATASFKKDNEIMFFIHMEEQIPFTATYGQTWGEWIQSFPGYNTSGNGILWVSVDQKLFIDPKYLPFASLYGGFTTGSQDLEFVNNSYETQTLRSVIVPNGVYGSRACCFDAGTKILMADKTLKNIEEVVVGDKVLSYNEKTGEFEQDVVTRCITKHNSDDLVYIVLSDDTRLGMRAYHPLLTTEGWKSLRPDLAETTMDISEGVSLLAVGDTLKGPDGTKTIKEIIAREDIPNYNTYNLTVAKNHNYIAEGIVAHNAACQA